MTDYISREAVLNEIGELFTICSETMPNELGHHYITEDEIEIYCKRIKSFPAADVVEVVHGKWIHGREVSRDYVGDACVCIRYEKWWCSECKYTVDLGEPLWHYCPKCGAKMDGGNGDG